MFLHLDGHQYTPVGIFLGAFAFRIAKKDHDRVTNEFIDGATVTQGNARHLAEVGVEHFGKRGQRQLFGDGTESLDVGKEHGQALASGFQLGVTFAGKNRSPYLGRQILGQLAGHIHRLLLLAPHQLLCLLQVTGLQVGKRGGGAHINTQAKHGNNRQQHWRLFRRQHLKAQHPAHQQGADPGHQHIQQPGLETTTADGVGMHNNQQHHGRHQRKVQQGTDQPNHHGISLH